MRLPRPPDFKPVALSLLLLLSACGKDRMEVVVPDTTAPAAVSDLTTVALSDTSIQLIWTATGDDGDEGQASRYDIRINPEPFPHGHFPPLPTAGDSLVPAPAGTTQTVTVGGLTANTTYYFAMKVGDEIPNWSPLSNVAGRKTLPEPPPPDRTPPQAITDLNVIAFTPTSVTLTWTSVGDDGATGIASSYDVRYAPEPISEATWDFATEVPGEPTPAAPGKRETLKAEGLTPGKSIYFAIKAADEVPNWSTVSASIQAMTNIPRTWRIYVDGSGDAATIQEAIDRALAADTVLVHPGTYYENMLTMSKDLVIRSAEGPEVTILDGSRKPETILMMTEGVTPATVIQGLTFTNGHETREFRGGGMTCLSAFPTVRGNHFRRNSAPTGGGILFHMNGKAFQARVEGNLIENNEASNNAGGMGIINTLRVHVTLAVIEGNEFRNNRVVNGDGGGLWVLMNDASIAVTGNAFIENETGDHGGGIYIGGYYDRFQIVGNLIVGNAAFGLGTGDTGSGGGVWLSLINGAFRHNTLVGNRGEGESPCSGGGVLLEGIGDGLDVSDNIIVRSEGCAITLFRKHHSARLGRNIFWDNDGTSSAKNYTGGGDSRPIEEPLPAGWEDELLFVDPQFCNESNGDYRVAATSPAVIGKEVMGAYEEPGCANSSFVRKVRSPR